MTRYPLTVENSANSGRRSADGAAIVNPVQAGAVPLAQRVLTVPTSLDVVLRDWKEAGVAGGVGVQYRAAYGTDNSYLLDCAKARPDLITPVVVVDAQATEAPDLLHGMVRTQRIAGLRLTGPSDQLDWLASASALRLWRVADSLSLAVVVMYLPDTISPSALDRVAGLASQYPKTRVVLDHCGFPLGEFGGGRLPTSYGSLHASRNVALKFTTVNLNMLQAKGIDPALTLRGLADAFGANRLMWGSDAGSAPGRYRDMVTRAVAATSLLSPRERGCFLSSTARRAFWRH